MMSKARILYIEDDMPSRILVRKLLTVAGFEVHEAEDGPRGLEAARVLRPDLILLDMTMPGISGLEVAARLREEPALAGTVVIALTASVMEGERERILASGCDGYLSKPIDHRAFADQVRGYLAEPARKANASFRQ